MKWRNVKLKHLCIDAGQYGLNVSAEDYVGSGARLIRTSDITESGKLKPAVEGVYVNAVLEDRHTLRPGDLLLSRSGSLGRALLIPQSMHVATYAGYLVRFRPCCDVDPRFLSYVASSGPFQDAIKADAVSSTIQNFNAERYANLRILAPPLEEQRRIADFLEIQSTRVRALQEVLAAYLQALNERFRVVIDTELSAVTGEVKPLKYLSSVVDTEHKTAPCIPGGGYWIAGTSAVKRGCIIIDSLYETDRSTYLEWTKRRVPSYGDILLSREAPVGEVGLYCSGGPRIAIGQRMVLLSPVASQISSEFLLWSLLSSRAREFYSITTQGSLHPHLNMRDIGSIPIYWCSRNVQSKVVSRITKAASNVESAGVVHKQMSEALLERYQALITAAVTGRIDVTTARSVEE